MTASASTAGGASSPQQPGRSSAAGGAAASGVSDASLEHRLSLGATSKAGARGSLTRCAVRLGELVEHERAETSAATAEDDDDGGSVRDAVVRELRLFQVELAKLHATARRAEAEVKLAERGLEDARDRRSSLSARVRDLDGESKVASRAQSCREEYEILAKLVLSRHAVPSHELRKRIVDVDTKLKQAERELRRKSHEVHVRQSQFQLLMSCVSDLKQSLDEGVVFDEDGDEAMRALDEREEEGEEGGGAAGGAEEDKMEVDDVDNAGPAPAAGAAPAASTDDDDVGLYDDL